MLHNPHACFIWVGKGSIGDEQHCAKEVLKRISISDYDLLLEGKDEKPKDKWETFWQMLGGKADYGSAKQSWVSYNLGKSRNSRPHVLQKVWLTNNAFTRAFNAYLAARHFLRTDVPPQHWSHFIRWRYLFDFYTLTKPAVGWSVWRGSSFSYFS